MSAMQSRPMKDSGVEWIGEIPEEWYLLRLKDYYSFEKGKNAALYTQEYIGQHSGSFPVYSGQTENNGIMGLIDTFDYDIDECLFTTTVGAKVMTPKLLRGRFSLSQNCLIMKRRKACNNSFIYYALYPLFDYAKSLIPVYMQPSLRVSDLNKYYIFSPVEIEQRRIADFLDRRCAEIDRVIAETEKTIAEYKALKQSIITEAVTKGIRPNRPMKDSGIAWVGEIPADWTVSLLKYSIRWKSVKGEPDAQVLSLYRDYGIIPKDSRDDNHNVTSLDTGSYKVVDVGDFVINKMKAWQGSMAVSEYRGIVSPAYHVCEITNSNVNKQYFHYLMRNRLYLPEYLRLSTGMRIGQWDLGFDDFKNLPFILPSIEEQAEIVRYINQKSKEIDRLTEAKQQLLIELETYKKSIIYEYVTGKKEAPCE